MQLVRGKPSGATSRTAVGKVAPCVQCLGTDGVERPQWFWEGSFLDFYYVKNGLPCQRWPAPLGWAAPIDGRIGYLIVPVYRSLVIGSCVLG